MRDPKPMNPPKQNRRKPGANRLDPIDWHEFANDAVLNGNMSTLFHRPPTEDPSAYASPEALVEIEKRARGTHAVFSPPATNPDLPAVAAQAPSPAPQAAPPGDLPPVVVAEMDDPTVGLDPVTPTAGAEPMEASPSAPSSGWPAENQDRSSDPPASQQSSLSAPPAAEGVASGSTPLSAGQPSLLWGAPANSPEQYLAAVSPGARPSAELPGPTMGTERTNKKVKPIRSVHDALTLAGQILYQAMYGPPEGTAAKHCSKGYRQLAAETRLDKDTVRDLIADFKDKGIVREIASYNPDTRSPKTYEVLSNQAIVDLWRKAGFWFVTSGRQRPEFCTVQGHPHRSFLAR